MGIKPSSKILSAIIQFFKLRFDVSLANVDIEPLLFCRFILMKYLRLFDKNITFLLDKLNSIHGAI